MKLTPEVLMLIDKAREKMAMVDPLTRESFNDPVARTIIDEFHDLLDEALALCDLTNVETVEDISPGNLYYHFHNKDEILESIFADFEREIEDILA